MNAQIINKAGIEHDSGSKVDSDSDGSAGSASAIATGSLSASVQVKAAAAKHESANKTEHWHGSAAGKAGMVIGEQTFESPSVRVRKFCSRSGHPSCGTLTSLPIPTPDSVFLTGVAIVETSRSEESIRANAPRY